MNENNIKTQKVIFRCICVCTYTCICVTIMKNESMSLEENKKECVGGFGGRKEKAENV